MDFSYTETQDMIRETLSRFLADTYDFDSRNKMIASGSGRDPGIWKALAQDLGMLGASFSEAHGGLGEGRGAGSVHLADHGPGYRAWEVLAAGHDHRSTVEDESGHARQ